MDAIRVLMLVPNLRVSNGVASFAMNYYRHLDPKKIKMDFVTYKKIDSPYIDELTQNGSKVYYLPPIKNIGKHIRMCAEILKEGNYDIIHDNSLMVTYPLMLLAKKRVKIRILHSHSTKLGENDKRESRNRLFIPLLLKTANRFTACSSIAAEALFNGKTYDIIPNVIDAKKYVFSQETRFSIRQKMNCESKTVIGTVGRVTDAKNPFFAVDVIEKMVETNPAIEYWWIGSGALDGQLKDYVESKGLKEFVKLWGSREDVPMIYQAMDVFFLPSKFEGFGLACVEAQASGLNCVVSDVLPREVNVSGLVKFVSSDATMGQWVSTLSDAISQKTNRADAVYKVQNSICADDGAGELLTKLYLNYCGIVG